MFGVSRMGDRRTSRSFRCPVCQGIHGCKVNVDETVFCLRSSSDSGDYKFIKPLSIGMGGLFVLKGSEYKPPVVEKKTTLGDAGRNECYRNLIKQLSLKDVDRHRLRQRGLSDQDIAWLFNQGFRSNEPGQRVYGVGELLPGVRKTSEEVYQLYGSVGVLIPAKSPQGLITGFQVYTRNKDAKYVWLSSGGDIQRENGELPIFAVTPPLDRRTRSNYSHATLYVSGVSEGLGNAGAGALLVDDNETVIEQASKNFKKISKLQAEFNALVMGVQMAIAQGVEKLTIKVNPLLSPYLNEVVEFPSQVIPLFNMFVESLLSFDSWEAEETDNNRADLFAQSGSEGDSPNADNYIDLRKVVLVDGAAKAYYSALKHRCVVIGFGGGTQMASAPFTLQEYLRAFSPDIVLHAPDAGDTKNTSNIPSASFSVYDLLNNWGYEHKIIWWGQTAKTDNDYDELSFETGVELITPAEFLLKHTHEAQENILAKALPKKGFSLMPNPVSNPHQVKYRKPQIFNSGSRLDVFKSHLGKDRFILDSSAPGLGKSTSIARATPSDLGVKQIVHISQFATTSEEEFREFRQFRGVDQGRVLTDDGRIVKARGEEDLHLQANCIKGDWNDKQQEKGLAVSIENRCTGCPLFESGACKSTPGMYLHDKEKTLTSERYRTVIGGLFPETFLDSKGQAWHKSKSENREPGTILVFDDLLPFVEDMRISNNFIQNTLNARDITNILIDNHRPLWEHLQELRKVLSEKNALNAKELRSRLPEYPDKSYSDVISTEYAFVDMTESTRVWICEYLDTRKNGGFIYCDAEGNLLITRKNQKVYDVINHPAVAQVIFLDATQPVENIEKWLGVEGIPYYAERLPEESAEISYKQVIGLGDLGYKRSKSQSEKLEKIREKLNELYPDRAEIDIKSEVMKHTNLKDEVTRLIWLASSRGSNRAKMLETLVLIGTPRKNLQASIAEYCLMNGLEDLELATTNRAYPVNATNAPEGRYYTRLMKETINEEFAAFYHQKTTSEVIQGIHRLRPLRRVNTKLEIIFISEYPLDLPTEVIDMKDFLQITTEPLSIDTIKSGINFLQDNNLSINQRSLADALNISRGKLIRFLNSHRIDWFSLLPQPEPITEPPADNNPDSSVFSIGETVEIISAFKFFPLGVVRHRSWNSFLLEWEYTIEGQHNPDPSLLQPFTLSIRHRGIELIKYLHKVQS